MNPGVIHRQGNFPDPLISQAKRIAEIFRRVGPIGIHPFRVGFDPVVVKLIFLPQGMKIQERLFPDFQIKLPGSKVQAHGQHHPKQDGKDPKTFGKRFFGQVSQGLEKGVNERSRPRAAGQQEGSHEQKRQQDRQKPPLFVFLQEDVELLKKPTTGLS